MTENDAVPQNAEQHDIPNFEGQSVSTTKAKLGATTFEIDDAFYSLDEVTRFVIEVRVTNVNHVVNETTGLLQRVHTLKVVDAQPIFDVDLTDHIHDGS